MMLSTFAEDNEDKFNLHSQEPSLSSQGYDERARKFWSIYVKETEQHDKNRTETWNAGLFSAAVTAFLIDSYKLLQPDSSDEIKDLLKQILAVQIAGASLNTSVMQLPTSVDPPVYKPSTSAITVNVLWFLSLLCSLATALGVTLVQQWIRDYLQRIEQTSQPQRRAMIRGIMFLGSKKWQIHRVVEYIPSLLHFSLFFFAGLCTFLWDIDKVTAGVVVAVVICCLSFYTFATIAPLLDSRALYETPFSHFLWYTMRRFVSGPQEAESLSQLREDLASSRFDPKAVQKQMQAVSWVYDRTTDDYELQDLLESIPGLLSSQDGREAWKVFCLESSQSAQEVEPRTVRLLNTCSPTGNLDPKSRKQRATLCIDSLLAFSSFSDSFKPNSLSNTFEFDQYILAPWEDDGTLATKAACAETLFRRRSLISEIPKIKSNFDPRDLENADQALRDIASLDHPYFPDPLYFQALPYIILGYLRMHEVYPTIQTDDLLLQQTSSGFVNIPHTSRKSCHGPKGFKLNNPGSTTQEYAVETSNPERNFSSFIEQELSPFKSLLSTLGYHPVGTPLTRWDENHSTCHLMSLITQSDGPFHLFGVILTAIIEDEGTVGGLLMLISTLKFYKPTKPFKPSVIDQWLETICPCLSDNLPPDSEGSQILLILALLEILVWEREWSSDEDPFPFSGTTIYRLTHLVPGGLTHLLPVELAERALGVTPDNQVNDNRIQNRAIYAFMQFNVERERGVRLRSREI